MGIYEILNSLDIEYNEIEHKAVFTSSEAEFIKDMIKGEGVKNLFLKSKNDYYLVLTPDNKRVDLKNLSNRVNSHLSFASPEELKNILNLEPGSVTPLGLINDTKHEVKVLIDEELIGKVILVHPLVNTKTLSLKMSDLIKFIKYLQNDYEKY